MKKFLLLMGYLAGFVIGTKYTKPEASAKSSTATKKTTKKTPSSPKNEVVELGKKFLASHQKAFKDLKKEYWTEENKKLVLSKTKDLNKFLELAKGEIAEINEVMKKHGIDTAGITEKIESVYQEKKSALENFTKSPAGKSIKRKLAAYVGKIKKDISR